MDQMLEKMNCGKTKDKVVFPTQIKKKLLASLVIERLLVQVINHSFQISEKIVVFNI